MIKVDEREMRNVLLNRLATYKDCYLYEEYTIPSGKARADIIAVNGHVIAYEIKSDYDSLKRLSSQILEYDSTFEMNYIVTGEKFIREVRRIVPSYWGIVLIKKNEKGLISIKFERRAKLNPALDFESFIGLLSAEEIKKIALNQPNIIQKYSKLQIRKYFKQDLVKLLNNTLSIKYKNEIKNHIRNTLKDKSLMCFSHK